MPINYNLLSNNHNSVQRIAYVSYKEESVLVNNTGVLLPYASLLVLTTPNLVHHPSEGIRHLKDTTAKLSSEKIV